VSAEFVWRMEGILELYGEPVKAWQPVVCFDERPCVLHGDTRPPRPAQLGRTAHYDYEYQRNGTGNLFMLFQPGAGWRHAKVTDQRTKADFAQCMRDLVDVYFAHAEKIRVVLDTLNTHPPASLYSAFPPAEARRILNELEFHFTPKHASWLNVVEIELSVPVHQCLKRCVADMDTLGREVTAGQTVRNEQRATVRWLFDMSQARTKLTRLYPNLSS
jgi:DDE superfamily endonuclease